MGGICMECGRRRIGGIWSLVFFFFVMGSLVAHPLDGFSSMYFPSSTGAYAGVRCAIRSS